MTDRLVYLIQVQQYRAGDKTKDATGWITVKYFPDSEEGKDEALTYSQIIWLRYKRPTRTVFRGEILEMWGKDS